MPKGGDDPNRSAKAPYFNKIGARPYLAEIYNSSRRYS